jgi:hypothetical protein
MQMSLRIALLFLITAVEALATTIYVTPAGQTAGLNSPVSVDVNVSGLGSAIAPSVGTYDLDVAFDSTLLSFSSVIWGTGLDVLGLGDIQSAMPGVGTIELFELSLDSPSDLNSLQLPAFGLFTLNFSTLAVGTSSLTLNVVALGDADGVSLPADVSNGSVTVSSGSPSQVPEPNTALPLLLILGFRVLSLRRREVSTSFRSRTPKL